MDTNIDKFPKSIYYKHGYLFKIDSPAQYTQVSDDPSEMLIVFWNKPHWNTVQDIISKGKKITKQEFDKAFIAVQSWVNQQSFIQDTEPATEEDCREAAYEVYERNEDLQEALNDLR